MGRSPKTQKPGSKAGRFEDCSKGIYHECRFFMQGNLKVILIALP
jgi:hypothetical protein